MPRSTQDSLTHVLLLWVTLLSIIQVAFIIFFFTAGHHGPTKSSLTRGPQSTLQPQADHSTSLPPQDSHRLKGQMFTYKASEENGKIKWQSRYESNGLISEDEQGLRIKENGYYYINLQVTLKTEMCPCNATSQSKCMVKLKCNSRDILQGRINSETCSTGLLGKVERLFQGTTLEITEIPNNISDREFLTHLDIIMLQPQG